MGKCDRALYFAQDGFNLGRKEQVSKVVGHRDPSLRGTGGTGKYHASSGCRDKG